MEVFTKKSTIFKAVIIPSIIVLLSSCIAPANIASYTDPDFFGVRFVRICVLADIADIEKRIYFEDEFSEWLCRFGIMALPAGQLMPLTREWDEAQFRKRPKKYRIKGILKITIVDKGVRTVHVPVTSITEVSAGTRKNKKGRKVTKTNTTTTNTDASSYPYNWKKYEASLFDVRIGRNAWFAYSNPFNVEQIVRRMYYDQKI